MSTLPISRQSQLRSKLGCLTLITLVLILIGAVMVAVNVVIAPWAFYMGGHRHLLPRWQGWGRLHSNSAGGDYAIYVSLWPEYKWPEYNISRRLPHVEGAAWVCTPRGATFELTIGGDFERPLGNDLNGRSASFYVNRTFRRRYANPKPDLYLRGQWNNPDLVLDDHGSIARSFDHDARLYPTARWDIGEVSPVTLHEGSRSEFDAACRAVHSR
ncbi:MAG TPA: hypothetical protein VHA33_23385 [Candidatus Angelobacter sp.]|jgi:hypothetical protein|nr:hypothetical protein [Candidatus Angelobacter sp.]